MTLTEYWMLVDIPEDPKDETGGMTLDDVKGWEKQLEERQKAKLDGCN